ncbi:hypothetical protein FN846DRAFT_442244 [Sphaerosporella brunnea]|uniref:Uncharacterized protein n=1 Tax=Sphaerosporella brunnea TaxID=1250544 RepID=A0A5J5EGT6_9PEZI|nr:hypothetical protein FN846DRAFT_442244 [Sphaerosporella brunnea]
MKRRGFMCFNHPQTRFPSYRSIYTLGGEESTTSGLRLVGLRFWPEECQPLQERFIYDSCIFPFIPQLHSFRHPEAQHCYLLLFAAFAVPYHIHPTKPARYHPAARWTRENTHTCWTRFGLNPCSNVCSEPNAQPRTRYSLDGVELHKRVLTSGSYINTRNPGTFVPQAIKPRRQHN